MSDIDKRLKHASEAWHRLFTMAKPLNKNSSKPNNSAITPNTQRHNTSGTIKLTQDNLAKNLPWGDTLQNKADNVTRIYIQNVNGIQIQKDGGQFDVLCKIVKEVQADVLCIQEHNLDTTQYEVRHTLHHFKLNLNQFFLGCHITQSFCNGLHINIGNAPN